MAASRHLIADLRGSVYTRFNLFEDPDENRAFLTKRIGFSEKRVNALYENYRPLGACTGYIWNDIRTLANGNIDEMLKFVEIIPVPLTESLGTVTGKYPAKDKITSSAVDLLGEESIQRMLHITDTNSPYKFDLRRGALAGSRRRHSFRRRDLQEQARSGSGLPGCDTKPRH